MTTAQFFHRLLRFTDAPDLATLAASDALALVDCANAAICRFYAAAPADLRRSRCSGPLRGPVTITLGCTHDSRQVTGYPFNYSHKGFTLHIEGDEAEHEVVAQDGILEPYRGTTGVHSATLYGDVIQIDDVIKLVIPPVRLDTDCTLDPIRHNPEPDRQRCAGTPRYYWLEGAARSAGGTPPTYLRVFPLPVQDYRLTLEAELAPRKLVLSDITGLNQLPIAEDSIEEAILPLAAEKIAGTSLLAQRLQEGRMADAIPGNADRAELGARRIDPAAAALTPVYFGTEAGW